MPNRLILPPLLRTLEEQGLKREDVLILVATGLHRPNEGAELEELVGPEVVARYRVENHHGKAKEEHDYLGTTPNGVPVYLDARYVRADLKITTGLIEPHLMADNPDLKVFKQRILGKDYFVMDQWQLEELAKVVERCKVKVVSDGLPAETLRRCYVEPAATVEEAVADCLREYGPSARVAVIPKGPYVLPYVA